MSTTSTFQNIISTATDAFKNILGFENSHILEDNILPQRLYLNDISSKKWNSLKPTTTQVKYLPVVGFPSTYSWNSQGHKYRTNFVRYPFLQQIRQQQQKLRPTKTVDKSVYTADKTYKMRPSLGRKQLLSDIRSFNSSSLKSIPTTPSGPGLLSQAKGIMNSAIGGMKEALGMNSYPQAQINHDQQFLNDIANGDWKTLRTVTTQVSYYPVVGLPSGYSWTNSRKVRTNFIRAPFLKQIREGTKLRPTKIVDRSMYIPDRTFKLRNSFGRRQLLSDIRSFNRSGLKSIPSSSSSGSSGLIGQAKEMMSSAIGGMKEALGINTYPQAQIKHDRQFLNDIVNGNWKSLNKVSTNVRYQPVVGFPSGYSWSNSGTSRKVPTNFIRAPFLKQIREGTKLRPTKTVDKSMYIPDKSFKFSNSFGRKQLLSDIRSFNRSGLKSIPSSSSSSGSGLLSQAKGVMNSAIGGMKEALGMNTYPQSEISHEQPYLNDIAKGNWKSLNKVSTNVRYQPVVGFPSGYSWSNSGTSRKVPTNFVRAPFLKQIREGTKLRPVGGLSSSSDKWREGMKGWELTKPTNRQELLMSITKFDRSGLRSIEGSLIGSTGMDLMNKAKGFVSEQVDSVKEALGMNTFPQRETEHLAPFLDDIAKGNHETLKHVETRNKLEERKELMNDIRGFENQSLQHMGSS